MVDRDDLKCRIGREESLHQAGIGTCSLALQIGFFFDGTKRNIYTDEEIRRLTNVGRLFRAHPEEIKAPLTSSYSYAKVYIPGLGTELNDTTSEQLDSILDARQKALAGDYLDDLKSQAKETVVEAVKGDWSKVLTNKLGDMLTLKSSFEASFSAAKNAAKRALVEAVAPIRDNPLVADLLMTGVDARVDYAKNNFKLAVSDVQKLNQLPIKLIQVSVFGADLGAALARRFIEELLESVCTKVGNEYRYEESKVEVIFVGLFDSSRRSLLDMGDTVAEVSDWAGLLTKNPAGVPLGVVAGAKVIEYDKPLHPAVKRALHLVAAHERRDYRPLLPLGPLKSGWREELSPGISEDVTGGLLPNEQRPSAELCRVPLRKMFDTARRAQVPFPNFRTLDKNDPYVASYFVMLDNLAGRSVQDFSDYYQKWAGRVDPTPAGFERHMNCYCIWLGEKLFDYQARLEVARGSERDELKARWGWLEQVGKDANDIVMWQRYQSKTVQAAKYVKYFNESQRVPREVDAFFNYFMHDFSSKELKHATLNAQANTMLRSNNFFVPRGIETVEADEEAAA
ncbi:DUF2235 domain-containing protein [Aeromonas dhakensis]|uniref:DUF2235 domain-containing protein n=1 Tax=Aeromonas hydrophila TaxID=644 RepID=Q6TP04_AERHY|nr:DUF2235 domain-containing protein [Aeromonas dhakensis]AAQ95771.1 hypothetical protein [Aeromonas hydrophila]MBL0524816.1 DUF2235 domain-containing protein [Aeromonas dhakensis]BEE08935.1 hypothetical protein VAWG003_17440 [Aeromonas dhakensis]BEE25820.1 hypothetical protein VAWG005_17480 [Aeromonas dhakensis]